MISYLEAEKMKEKKKPFILTVLLQSLAALVLFSWSVLLPLWFSLAEGDHGYFVELLVFMHVNLTLLGIPAYIVIPTTFLCFGFGCRILYRATDPDPFSNSRIFGFALTLAPIIVIALAPIAGQYRGP